MNMHVSLHDLQLFVGKEGDIQARRTWPVIQRWAESQDARRAIWHAGQIIAYAKVFPHSQLKEFWAVAVQHAGLAIWTYGTVQNVKPSVGSSSSTTNTVLLDGPDSPTVQHYITTGQGQACVRAPPRSKTPSLCTPDQQQPDSAALDDAPACMAVVQQVFAANYAGGLDVPPAIVDNLCTLLGRLADVARKFRAR